MFTYDSAEHMPLVDGVLFWKYVNLKPSHKLVQTEHIEPLCTLVFQNVEEACKCAGGIRP